MKRLVAPSATRVTIDPDSQPDRQRSPRTYEALKSSVTDAAQVTLTPAALQLRQQSNYITSTGPPVTNLPCGNVVRRHSRDAAPT